ncbi:bacteriochlorophyll 4-vinyl reductase [Acidiphilium sp. 20-67-58]|uniref:bacteriochlorophyll 4-vinyl reductase n=1 Tax=Acidiphilium sp. 20-67-58 TaxID=1970291 RepID=UPI0025C4812B|nr:bacteriochlorophyll 4-vinyl reductase [Acidiphilium sp. 20-67-58]HQT62254.1 bacteriochlorophyll 4-vinyl reductase [Acidiphilium sp.]
MGPNAILQVFAALAASGGPACVARVARAAGAEPYLAHPPAAMVPAADVLALHRAVRACLGAGPGGVVLRAAGAATGRYLLARRIPRPVRLALRAAPAPLAARLLVAAIRRHAWTFGMPDGLDATWRGGLRLTLATNPIAVPGTARPERPSSAGSEMPDSAGIEDPGACNPGCAFHAGTFEVLFQALVDRRLVVREESCRAAGQPACVFTIGRG